MTRCCRSSSRKNGARPAPPPAPAEERHRSAGRWTTVLAGALAVRAHQPLRDALRARFTDQALCVVGLISTGPGGGKLFRAYGAADGKVLRIDPTPAALDQPPDGRQGAIHGGIAQRRRVAAAGRVHRPEPGLLCVLGAWAFLQRLTRRRAVRAQASPS